MSCGASLLDGGKGIFFFGMRKRISHDGAVLDALHACHGWIPSSAQVRPSESIRDLKATALANGRGVERVWKDVFGGVKDNVGPRFCLCRQPFPYQIPDQTVHLVAWTIDCSWSDHTLCAEIGAEIDRRGGGDYVYYSNPKKSIENPRMDHVHVFWRPRLLLTDKNAAGAGR